MQGCGNGVNTTLPADAFGRLRLCPINVLVALLSTATVGAEDGDPLMDRLINKSNAIRTEATIQSGCCSSIPN